LKTIVTLKFTFELYSRSLENARLDGLHIQGPSGVPQ